MINWNQLFDSNDFERSGRIPGGKARELFIQSKLSNSDLAGIYGLCDLDKDGQLNRLEFCLAMKLISVRTSGGNLPTELPQELKVFAQSLNPNVSFPATSYSSPVSSAPTKTPSVNPPPLVKDDSKTIQDLQNQLREAETKVKELQLQINSITNQRNQFESNYKRIVNDKKSLETELRDVQLRLAKANDRANEFESKVIQAEARLSVLSSRGPDPTATFTSQLERKDKELTQLRDKLRTSESKTAEAEAKLSDMKWNLESRQSFPPSQPFNSEPRQTFPPSQPFSNEPRQSFPPSQPLSNEPRQSFPPSQPFSNEPRQSFPASQPFTSEPPLNFMEVPGSNIPIPPPPPFPQNRKSVPEIAANNPILPPPSDSVSSFSITNPPSTTTLSSDNPFLLGLNLPSGG
jgi:hypothetical protein